MLSSGVALTVSLQPYMYMSKQVYSEDMYPVYSPLPWLHTPRLRLGVTIVAEDIWGAYLPRRCGISDLYHVTAAV